MSDVVAFALDEILHNHRLNDLLSVGFHSWNYNNLLSSLIAFSTPNQDRFWTQVTECCTYFGFVDCKGHLSEMPGPKLCKSPGTGRNVKAVEQGEVYTDDSLNDSLTHLSFSGRLNIGITRVTDDVVNLLHRTLRNWREGRFAVVGKVAVNLPRLSKVCWALDHHGGRSERLRKRMPKKCSFTSTKGRKQQDGNKTKVQNDFSTIIQISTSGLFFRRHSFQRCRQTGTYLDWDMEFSDTVKCFWPTAHRQQTGG